MSYGGGGGSSSPTAPTQQPGFPPPGQPQQQQQQQPGYSQFMMSSGGGPPQQGSFSPYGSGSHSPYHTHEYGDKGFGNYPTNYHQGFYGNPSPGGSVSSGPGSPYHPYRSGMRHPSPPTGSPGMQRDLKQGWGSGSYPSPGQYGYNGFDGANGSMRPRSTSPNPPNMYPTGGQLKSESGFSGDKEGNGEPKPGETSDKNNDSRADTGDTNSENMAEEKRYSPKTGNGSSSDRPEPKNGADFVDREMEAMQQPQLMNPNNLEAKDSENKLNFDNQLRSQARSSSSPSGGGGGPVDTGPMHQVIGDMKDPKFEDLYSNIPPLAAIEGMHANQEAEFISMQQHQMSQHPGEAGKEQKYVI